MIELPEATTLAKQMSETLKGKRIAEAVAGFSPHKFTWYWGDPAEYGTRLEGKVIEGTQAFGGRVELDLGDVVRTCWTARTRAFTPRARLCRPSTSSLFVLMTALRWLQRSRCMAGCSASPRARQTWKRTFTIWRESARLRR
ncbi:MAG: hypothetical protein LBD02_08205 [Christensenellaceae bacterium]|nr:hypothetical protein [Christensenellaceae bacterium]